MASLSDALKAFCEKVGFDKTYWIALSGGLDSTVLLSLAAELRTHVPLKLKAIHVHHGLSPHADDWLQHCELLCQDLQIEFFAKKINATAISGESPEEVARAGRYQVFSDLLTAEDVLLSAHHQDDQAETLLLQLFRGAGVKGLASMPALKPFAKGLQGRPLLNFSRDELQTYADTLQLRWITDESNTNTQFTRNFIRHDIMPLLKSRWPSLQNTLARTAEHCGQADALLNHFIESELNKVRGTTSLTLSVKKILALDSHIQLPVLRQWIIENNFSLPSTVKLQHIVRNVLHASIDRFPSVTWGDIELRRYRDDLYLLPKTVPVSLETFSWNLEAPLAIGNRMLRAMPTIGEGLSAEIKNVTVRFRQGGEKFKLPGRKHHHELKKLFQAWGIPPWLREQIPLIFVEEELAAVVGFAVADPFVAKLKGWNLLLES